jgi:hypothetical protein
MIRLEEILQKGEEYRLAPKELRDNISELLYKINIVRYFWNKQMIITSGYREDAYNKKVGGSLNSWHTKGLAIDVHDSKNELYNFLTTSQKGIDLSTELGLYFEHKDSTPTWCHIQLRAPKSGKMIFYP